MEPSKVYFTNFRTQAFGDGLPTKLKKMIKKAGIGDIERELCPGKARRNAHDQNSGPQNRTKREGHTPAPVHNTLQPDETQSQERQHTTLT